ncbi:unnamed protein product [Victoria cruziana]
MADEDYDDEEPPRRAKRNRPRRLRDFYVPNEYNQGEATMGPDIGATQFEIKASVINLLPSFHGIENEDPYRHLDEFIDVCGTVRVASIGDDALRLRLFPFSLKDKARHWLKSLNSKTRIQTWEELQREFLKRYFPIGKTNQFRRAITSFAALDGETFYQSWERMKELLRKCPHHQVPKWQILQGFYEGLSDSLKQAIDSSCGGSLMLKDEDEAWDLFDTLAENSLHHAGPSAFRLAGKKGVLEVGQSTQVQGQLDALSRKMDQLLVTRGASGSQSVCTGCGGSGHDISECQYYSYDSSGQVNAAQGFSRPGNDPYSSTYNPGWRNHPNFGWRTGGSGETHAPSGSAPPHAYQSRQPQYQQPPRIQGSSSSSTMEDRLTKVCEDMKTTFQQSQARYDRMFEEQSQNFSRHDQILASHTHTLQNLEKQMGQMASSMNFRQSGSLPSQPEGNPRGKGVMGMHDGSDQGEAKFVHALRSGRDYHAQQSHIPAGPQVMVDSEPERESEHHSSGDTTSASKRPPFPKALGKPSQSPNPSKDQKIKEIYDLFRGVHINIPLLDAIVQVPAYARFLKEMCTQKRRARKQQINVILNEQVSQIIQQRIPLKMADPGTPIIPCSVGHIKVERALLDLGASVNVLPGFFYDLFQLGGLKPTPMTIQLADRSVKVPRGILEDVLVKVEDFVFPVDFIILDMEGVDLEHQTPIILGRPFLATANACINCRTGVMDITFGNKRVRLNVFNAAMGPAGDKCISFAESERDIIEDEAREMIAQIIQISDSLSLNDQSHLDEAMYNSDFSDSFVDDSTRAEFDSLAALCSRF